jgi:Fur family ferric uptake transcriptional regulator
MSCEDMTVQVLKEAGHRLTPQRLMVVSAVRHAEGHVSASDIATSIKKSYPYIDTSTIYRTLGALKDMRLVSETDMGGGESIYEWIEPSRHHHLVCRSCDAVVLLDNKHVSHLGEQIIAEHGFLADLDHFAIVGLCEDCRPEAEEAG